MTDPQYIRYLKKEQAIECALSNLKIPLVYLDRASQYKHGFCLGMDAQIGTGVGTDITTNLADRLAQSAGYLAGSREGKRLLHRWKATTNDAKKEATTD